MKRLTLVIFCLSTVCQALSAQAVSTARVMADIEMNEFVWAVGYGETVEEADNDAMNTLATRAVNLTSTDRHTLTVRNTNQDNYTDDKFQRNMLAISNMYLEDVRREILPNLNRKDKAVRVLRYVTVEDWEARHDALKAKIEEYIESGKYASMVEDKIRYYTWAHVLIQTYPDTADPITVDSVPAKQWLYSQLREALDNIEITIIATEEDKSNRNYPYKLFLDFTYKGDPVSYLKFGFFDGGGYVENESVKDGRAVIMVKHLEPEIGIDIDCLSKDLARQIEPTVALLIENKQYASSFEEGHKNVSTDTKAAKPKKNVNTTSLKVTSAVNQQLARNNSEYAPLSSQVQSTQTFEAIMNDIASSISDPSNKNIVHHFTAEGWSQYQRIVANGAPMLARTPEYKFILHDTLTICQSIPVKLSFPGNHSFVEDVVFRVNNRTNKVESVAYKLSAKTEHSIMGMRWDDAARLTLITFLEDYRSAYCLKNLDYINKVFADDAYIITGRILKVSTRKFSDSPEAINGTTAVYERKSKQQYISDLRKSFISKEFINLRFEECNVAKGYGEKEGIYAVQVNQLYYSNNYADNGILTLAVDMRKTTDPLVRVRVWQQARDVTYKAEDMIERTVAVENEL